MALYNLARVTTATTGTGTITLGAAVAGFLTFASAGVPDGAVVTYAIKDGSNSEIGRGTYTLSGLTLTRTVLKSTNSNTAISLSGSAEVVITAAAEDLLIMARPGGRLTLTTATPVLTTTTTAQTTIYYTPYMHRFCPIYDGFSYTMHDLGGELSQTTTDTTKSPAACTTNSNYDLFVWLDGTTYRCTRGPLWTSSTARGTGAGTTELERVKGILLNKVAITNGPAANKGTYVGTIRTDGSSQVNHKYGAISSGGTAGIFGVWNAYNRRRVGTFVGTTSDSWTYSTATYREADGAVASSSMRVSYVCGLAEDAVQAFYSTFMSHTGGAVFVGIGVDTVSAYSGQTAGSASTSATNGTAIYTNIPGLGFHFVSAIEYSTTATGTFRGDGGDATANQQGLTVNLWM